MKRLYTHILSADKVTRIVLLLLLALFVVSVYLFRMQALIFIPAALVGIYFICRIIDNPYIGFVTILFVNYFIMGINRYLPDIPLGLSIDILSVFIYIILMLRSRFYDVPWNRAANLLTLLAGLWMFFAILQFFNPAAPSHIAWFYAVRGIALYFLLIVPLVFILFNRYKDLQFFLKLWAVFTLIAVFKVLVQRYHGFDTAEIRWLLDEGAVTHLLQDGIRYFSFFTDAGQFGAAMGQSAVIFIILATGKCKTGTRFLYLIAGFSAIYGLLLSGTRGAIAVPIVGFFMYLLLSKQIRTLFAGFFIIAILASIFKFTTIGDNYQTIRRMRTVLNPSEDPSMIVRLENQARLGEYLQDKPFGGGIGSTQYWGRRFSPNTFLATTATDSWLVAIWAEQGIVGLILYLGIMLTIIIKGCKIIFIDIKNKKLSRELAALLSACTGILVASYTNPILGQFPIGILFYTSLAFIFMGKQLDNETGNTTLTN